MRTFICRVNTDTARTAQLLIAKQTNVYVLLVYPSLESDEEDHANKAKMKRKRNWDDTPWSPKGILNSSSS